MHLEFDELYEMQEGRDEQAAGQNNVRADERPGWQTKEKKLSGGAGAHTTAPAVKVLP